MADVYDPEKTSQSNDTTPYIRTQKNDQNPYKPLPKEQQTSNQGSDGASESASDLGVAESAAGAEARTDTGDDNTPSFRYRDDERQSLKDRVKPKRSGEGSNKKKFILMGGLGLGGLGGIIVLFLFLSSLLIPNLAEHITEYQSARITREFAEKAQVASDEKLAIDSIPETANDSIYNSIKEKFTGTAAGQRTSDLWAKLDNYRPSKILEGLSSDKGGNLTLNYNTNPSGLAQLTTRAVLQGVTLNNVEYTIKSQGLTKYLPGFGQLIKLNNGVSFTRNFVPDFIEGLKANDVGFVARSVAAKTIRQKLGITLTAWVVGKYAGKTPKDALVQEAEDKAVKVDNPGSSVPNTAATEEVKTTVDTATQDYASDITNPQAIQQAINNDGVLQNVKDAISKGLSTSGVKTAITIGNPLYGVALPLCIIYDGSLDKSGPTVDQQTKQQQAAYYYIASAADQQKAGQADPEAVGALNTDLNIHNNISASNPEIRAAGNTINTSQIPSAEASASGEYTLLDTLIPNQSVAGGLDAFANATCPVLTNLYVAGGVAAVNLIVGIFTGGTEDAAGDAAGNVAEKALADEVGTFGVSAAENVATKTTFGKIKGFLGETASTSAKLATITLAAKMIVLARASQLYSGLSEGTDLANEADSGGNIAYNEISRQGYYGRPLDQNEVVQSQQQDQQVLASNNSQRSAYQRYFAFSNPDSLVSNLGMSLLGAARLKTFSSLFSDIGSLLTPLHQLANIFDGKELAFAQSANDTQDYGNVQFGWSQDEENLIENNQSYSPLENQQILDQAPQINGTDAEDAIAAVYGKCFTDSMGDLLSLGEITRDGNGNVINSGKNDDCSPINLGPSNPDPKYRDLVFRWRLAMSYNATLDQLTQEQDAIGGGNG